MKKDNKNSLKRRLQIRFVLLSLMALVLLQTVIVGFSIARSYQQMTVRADRLIRMMYTDQNASEIKETSYFRVMYYLKEKNFETDLTHSTQVSTEEAEDYAKQALDSCEDKGYIGQYRYLVHRTKIGIQITFLSREMAMEALQTNCKTLIGISALGIVVMAIALTAASSAITAPLVRSHQKQKEFITSASHELKTPLTVINADAQLLESEIGENEWLQDILHQVERMTEMTHRLVYLARLEEQGNELVKIDFPISDVAEELAKAYQSVAKTSGKEYAIRIQEDITYHGDEKAIRELMTVLLDNAFKYSPEQGQIKVELKTERQGVCFAVENTVEHVTEEQMRKFTDRFYRADTSDKVKGFGIGLSIARAVVEAHKGKLKAELPEKHVIRISAIIK